MEVKKMENKKIAELKEIIKELEENYDEFNDYVWNFIDEETLKELDIEDLEEFLVDLDEDGAITRTEVIYYANAIKYLLEKDPSLNESLELAAEIGYELKNINSEVLASLLQTHNNREDYEKFVEEVIEKF
tara:strand:+ start:57 stop:449 length:393 start_codon:yes stop_codon:yes gene_type:complete